MMTQAAQVVLLLLVVVASGCGSGDYSTVTGVVTYNGEPVDGATVLFRPIDRSGGGVMSAGKTGPDGSYRLFTQGSERNDGAKPGSYQVTVSALESVGGDAAAAGLDSVAMINARAPQIKSRLPNKYRSVGQSGLQFEVTSGSNVANFDLTD